MGGALSAAPDGAVLHHGRDFSCEVVVCLRPRLDRDMRRLVATVDLRSPARGRARESLLHDVLRGPLLVGSVAGVDDGLTNRVTDEIPRDAANDAADEGPGPGRDRRPDGCAADGATPPPDQSP